MSLSEFLMILFLLLFLPSFMLILDDTVSSSLCAFVFNPARVSLFEWDMQAEGAKNEVVIKRMDYLQPYLEDYIFFSLDNKGRSSHTPHPQ